MVYTMDKKNVPEIAPDPPRMPEVIPPVNPDIPEKEIPEIKPGEEPKKEKPDEILPIKEE